MANAGRNQLDFTEGSIMKKMVIFAFPIFIGNLLQSSYQIVDSLWVGNLIGAEALGAVSLASTILFSVLSFIIGINSATLTVLSQRVGADDDEGLKRSLNAFVSVLGTLAIILGAIGFFAAPTVLTWMGTPPDILESAVIYLRINFIGIVFLFGYNFIGTVLRAVGDSKTPLRFIMLAVGLNIFLDPLFISGFDMGIQGAAIATVISQGSAFVFGIVYMILVKGLPFAVPSIPEKAEFQRIMKLGLPAGLSMMAISGGQLAIMTVVTSFGAVVLSGYGAAQRLDSLIMLPATTLGSAITSMAGQNIGANRWDRISSIAKNALILILIVSITMSTAVFLLAEFLMGLFVNDEATIQYGKTYLQIVAFFYPFLGINFVLNGIVRSSGAMIQVLALNIISFWVLRFPLAWFFSERIGENGIALGIGASFVISAVISASYYIFGGWNRIDIFKEEKKKGGAS
ncbi:MATE family efflux transporter [Marinococcus halophilus]|uniref:Putative multidrug resistance protein YpnP n=1 Tax=Marinococcus halophilus TaxID=1371 RepID=A0A510Y9C8_MARHA|nr:MATE family efflux transporter [Marinococcus halophilus]OZT79019.1 MATE family efflux transporter [Marinococcus halophilus]GEK59996.1 putative multidrug resistance protein YpnP [Marinococcus halophilus]